MIRKSFVWLHRWAGLLIAVFLIFQGISGGMLAFYDNLDRLIAPRLHASPRGGVPQLKMAILAESATALVPHGRPSFISMGFSQLFIDPWTGKELGRRRAGDISEGIVNFMPFVFRLHKNLALGMFGAKVLGVVALLWTLDCFVGFYLTLPVAFTKFWRRWRRAWLLKWRSSAFRVNFDLHRAGGLWLWPMLLIFAWSGVMLNLPRVYKRAMHSVLAYQSTDDKPPLPSRFVEDPKLDWRAALATTETLMADQAASRGLIVVNPKALFYSWENGTYGYIVHSYHERSGRHYLNTSLRIDGNTADLITFDLPDLKRGGAAVDAWLFDLHTAQVFGTPYRVFVCILGLVIAMLSITGIFIWWKKRIARRRASLQRGSP
jgi:uncharacterized iron-regulated membrane protein